MSHWTHNKTIAYSSITIITFSLLMLSSFAVYQYSMSLVNAYVSRQCGGFRRYAGFSHLTNCFISSIKTAIMTGKRTQDQDISAQEPHISNGATQNDNEPSKKRRRRILSCDACRRLKTRCEIEYGSDTCSRCRNLRITCIKSDGTENSNGSNEANPNTDLVKR